MAIVKMDRIFLAGLVEERMRIVERLLDLGVVQVDDFAPEEVSGEYQALVAKAQPGEERGALDAELYRIRHALDTLAVYDHEKKPLFAKRRPISRTRYREIAQSRADILALADEVGALAEELDVITADKNHIDRQAEQLSHFAGLDIPLELERTRYLRVTYGTIPAELDMTGFAAEMEQAGAYFWEIGADEWNRYVGAMYHVDTRREVVELLEAKAFSEVRFPALTGTAAENLMRLEKEKAALDARFAEVELTIQGYLNKREFLEIYFDYLSEQRDKTDAVARMVDTRTVFLAKGWVPAAHGGHVRDVLEEEFSSILVEVTSPAADEDTPILLQNNKLVQPFELVTELYSLPRAWEADPNPVMSVFYFIFFGLMLSDAGYGIVLTLLTGFVVWRYQPEGIMGKLMRLLCFCGISTTVWGVLFGGWFGDITGLSPVWFNPVEDPMTLLIWSFAFGALHLFAGMGMHAYLLIRKGKWLDAVFDIGFWYAVLIGIVLLLVDLRLGAIVAGAGAVGLILTQGRHEKNIFKKLFSGVASLYDITGYLSDVLSYSRLLALGLATGVIANVINTMCRLGSGNIWVFPLVAIGFAIGHTFNLAINTLGAYVHASRLQYVEFFGKFYEGGGQPFRPFRRKAKYVDVK